MMKHYFNFFFIFMLVLSLFKILLDIFVQLSNIYFQYFSTLWAWIFNLTDTITWLLLATVQWWKKKAAEMLPFLLSVYPHSKKLI